MLKNFLLIGTFAGISLFGSAPNIYANDVIGCKDYISVVFREGAPVDKFKIKNQSKNWKIKTMDIDLSSSQGRLIFDTISGGKGVEVFQPYQSVSGSARLATFALVEDGADAVKLNFEKFSSGDSYTFSIDVDDQLTASDLGQIRVTGEEIAKAKAIFMIVNSDGSQVIKEALFDDTSKAVLKAKNCKS